MPGRLMTLCLMIPCKGDDGDLGAGADLFFSGHVKLACRWRVHLKTEDYHSKCLVASWFPPVPSTLLYSFPPTLGP